MARSCSVCFARVVLLAAFISFALCAPYYVDYPDDPMAIYFSCEEHWCNESWRGDRILRYNLSVYYEILPENESQHIGPVLNCNGGQISSECVLEGSGTSSFTEIETVVNRTLVSIEELGHKGLLVTDNYDNMTRQLENTYRGNQEKIWQIKIPYNCQLLILFDEFDLEATADCDKDYLSVQTSKNQPDIRKYCKSLESIRIQRRRRVQLRFHADDSIERRGFSAEYCFREIRTNSSQMSCDCNQGETHSRGKRQSEKMRDTDEVSVPEVQKNGATTQQQSERADSAASTLSKDSSPYTTTQRQLQKKHKKIDRQKTSL